MCAPAAYVLSRFDFIANKFIQTSFVSAMGVPAIMVVLPLFSIISGMGILNNVAAGRTVLIILYVGINVPYTTIFLLTFFSNISRTYEEAAAIDGCPPMRTFWKIMFPMAQSGIVTVTIFNFINIWNEYFLSLIFASSDKLKPVAPGLYGMINSMKYTGDWAGMFAAVIIVFLPTFILYISCLRRSSVVLPVALRDNIRGQQDITIVAMLLFTHHYPARCFGMNMPKSRDIQAKIHCRRQSGMNFGYVTVNGVNSNKQIVCVAYIWTISPVNDKI